MSNDTRELIALGIAVVGISSAAILQGTMIGFVIFLVTVFGLHFTCEQPNSDAHS